MDWFSEMTEGPWWVDLTALSGAIVAVGIILRMVVWPGLKAFWKAIVAAPQIAAGVGKLVEILETDLLHRVELVEAMEIKQTAHLAEHDATLSGYLARLNAHDMRLDAVELEINVLKLRDREK